uniref:Uncharacterized protein n=1 Tax=Solanum lycopersicum TaxID=4081 RepID=A0A3Q7G184_SOLLC
MTYIFLVMKASLGPCLHGLISSSMYNMYNIMRFIILFEKLLFIIIKCLL